jgi:pimeloyl-[acyl-carrier protein] methyl ester esterase
MTPISLVLLPGLDGTGILFAPLLAAIPPSIKPIVVSYPQDRHLLDQELLPLVLERLPRDGPFILLGESFSGPLAVMVAEQRPAGLVGFILCASFVVNPRPIIGTVFGFCARPFLFRLFPLMQRTKAKVGRYSTSELGRLLAEVHARVNPHVMAARLRMVFRVDVREAFRACELPMLYLAGGRDWVVPSRNVRVAQRINPRMRRVTIDSPHMVLQTQAEQCAKAIECFADSLRSTSSESIPP